MSRRGVLERDQFCPYCGPWPCCCCKRSGGLRGEEHLADLRARIRRTREVWSAIRK